MSGQITEEITKEICTDDDIIDDIIIKENIIKHKKLSKEELIDLPENTSIFRCNHCKYIFRSVCPSDVEMIIRGCINETCPLCETDAIDLICKVDVYSIYLKVNNIVDCRKATIIPKTDLCPVCRRSICPICYNHNCIGLSRVTGYIQDISGWNEAKKQELIDRKRYTIGSDSIARIQ